MLWFIFFFKQKTAYEMRISDWSSDVCSSDLAGLDRGIAAAMLHQRRHATEQPGRVGADGEVGIDALLRVMGDGGLGVAVGPEILHRGTSNCFGQLLRAVASGGCFRRIRDRARRDRLRWPRRCDRKSDV